MSSPTQRSLKYLRARGMVAQVVEKFNHFAKIRQDLFGVIDIVAMSRLEGIVGVQTTTYSNMSARREKIKFSNLAYIWLESGGHIWLHGWKKLKNGRWELKEERIR